MRFSKLHLLTQFYVHNVLHSQTRETEVTKYHFVQWVRKHQVLHLVLCTWEAENSCCWWTSDENSNLLLITDHIRTSTTYPSATAVRFPVKETPVGCCCGPHLPLVNANTFWPGGWEWAGRQLCSAPPNHGTARGGARQPHGFWRERAQHPLRSRLQDLWKSSCRHSYVQHLVTRLNT